MRKNQRQRGDSETEVGPVQYTDKYEGHRPVALKHHRPSRQDSVPLHLTFFVISFTGINSEILSELWKEIEVVCTLRHPNICLFLGAAMVPPTYCLGQFAIQRHLKVFINSFR